MALALEGDIEGASRLVRRSADRVGRHPDHVVAWVALNRAAGRPAEALAVVERLLAAAPVAPRWLRALQVRLLLDAGEPVAAAEAARATADLPPDLAVAALARAGAWTEARTVWRAVKPRPGHWAQTLAALDAGVAAERAGAGDERGARRALKRALSASPPPVSALVVGEALARTPGEAARFAARLAARLHGGRSLSEGSGIDETALDAARQAYEAGRVEAALGGLRDALDRAPSSWPMRAQYATWLVAHGEAADWRAELMELGAVLAVRPTERRWACEACGHVAEEPWGVCPRCDAIDRLTPAPMGPLAAVRAPSMAGAQLDDLRRLAGGARPAGPG